MIYKGSGIIFIVKVIVQTSIFIYLTYFVLMSMKSLEDNNKMLRLTSPRDGQFPSNNDRLTTMFLLMCVIL